MKFFNRSNPSKVIFHDKMFCEECVETEEEELPERESTLKGIKAKEKGIPQYNSWDCAPIPKCILYIQVTIEAHSHSLDKFNCIETARGGVGVNFASLATHFQ